MNRINCPLCGLKNVKSWMLGTFDKHRVSCDVCKEYLITDDLLTFSREYLATSGYILSGLSREINEIGAKIPEFSIEKLEEQLKDPLIPDVRNIEEKTKKLLKRLKERSDFFGAKIFTKDISDYPLAYSKNTNEYNAFIDLLKEKKLIDIVTTYLGINEIKTELTVTAKGWEIISSSENLSTKSDQGFIASWFHPSTDKSISIMKDAIEESGYKAMCINGEHFPERIMDKALGEIRRSRFVVIDLTGNRGSVFFEAGFTFGLGIESIYVYKKGSAEPGSALEFYVKHYQCYEYDDENDLKEKLKNIIAARLPKK